MILFREFRFRTATVRERSAWIYAHRSLTVAALNVLLLVLAILLLASAQTAKCAETLPATQPNVDIDSPDYWAAGRKQITSLGDGFLVWEARRGGHYSIWTIQLDGTGLKQLTPVEENRDQQCPHISPDGKQVAYLSLPLATASPESDHRSPLHLINADGTGDRIIVPNAHKYGGGWDRAVVWLTPTKLAYVGPDDNTIELDLLTGQSKTLITGGGGWLPNVTMTHVAQAFNTFSLLDAESKTVTPMPHLGGCQCYFTHDGQWGFWMANMGGPIGKMRLSTREWSVFLDPAVMPKERNYCYFPNVSSSQCLLAFAAANHEKLRGGYGGYDLSDYNVFVLQIDPNTLDVVGQPVRYSFDPVCNRFPDVYQPSLALGFQSNKAPFSVSFSSPVAGDWKWDFGDGAAATGATAKHDYANPGLYFVSASQGGHTQHGEVRVLPARAPKALSAALEGERELLVTFDEPVDLKADSIKLASGAAIEKSTPSSDGRTLDVTLAAKPLKSDALLIDDAFDRAQHPNKMEPAKLPFEPRLWPVNPRGLIFVWQTAEKHIQVIDPGSGRLRGYRFLGNNNAKLDENHALRPDGGSFLAENFNTQFGDAVRKSNSYSIEMTVTPEAATDDRIRVLCSYKLAERGDKLCYRIDQKLIEVCPLPPNKTSHILFTYTPGHLIFYLNGAQVFETDAIVGDLRGARGDALVIGNSLDNQPWLGAVEGIAIFDRVLSADEVRAEAEAYQKLRENRKPLATVELEATLAASSRTPKLAQIAPYKQALIVNEYMVNRCVAGHLDTKKIRVAHWAILGEQTLDVSEIPIGEAVHLVAAPSASCPQLEGEHVTDTLPEDFDAPLFYAVSAKWNHHAIAEWNCIGNFVPPPQDPNIEHGKAVADPAFPQAFAPESLTGLPASYAPAAGQQWMMLKSDAAGYVNLFQTLNPKSGGYGCGYAFVYVNSPTARPAILHAGTVGGFKAWLNGKQMLEGHFGRYPFVGNQDAAVELIAGWNTLLIKSTQLYGFWGFTCDLLTPEGKLMTDLTYNATGPN